MKREQGFELTLVNISGDFFQRLYFNPEGHVLSYEVTRKTMTAWKNQVDKELASIVEEKQLAEARAALELVKIQQHKLRQDYHSTRTIWQSMVGSMVRDRDDYTQLVIDLQQMIERNCQDLAEMKQQVDKEVQWDREYIFISDWMLQHYPDSQRAKERQKRLREEEEDRAKKESAK